MPSRRRVLLGIGTAVLLSGCSRRSTPTTRIEQVQLVNSDTTARQFALTIEADSGVVYKETHTVAPVEQEPIPVLTDSLPEEQGRLTVVTEILGTDDQKSYTYEDADCYSLVIRYSEGGLSYYSAEDVGECATTANS